MLLRHASVLVVQKREHPRIEAGKRQNPLVEGRGPAEGATAVGYGITVGAHPEMPANRSSGATDRGETRAARLAPAWTGLERLELSREVSALARERTEQRASFVAPHELAFEPKRSLILSARTNQPTEGTEDSHGSRRVHLSYQADRQRGLEQPVELVSPACVLPALQTWELGLRPGLIALRTMKKRW